jgi:alkanesulfonate monooxygenase SsuD/methylene tetrahydromethanopterin reductase-like flavin-dependent oxidoreductase (luciferase family)
MNQRKMRFGMSTRGHGYHPAAWRHPDVPADGTLQVEHYVRSAQTAERGKLDMVFFADGAGIRQGDNPRGSLARTGRDMIELEPTMLLPALAMVTRHIGLVATASTTYNEPYNLARQFATLDLISKGRAGCNVVASWSEHEAQNFGLQTTLDYDTRYARSPEFVDVVKGLWDGWDDGALLLDKPGGRYIDEAKMHVLNHQARLFKVRARSVDGDLHAAAPSSDRAGRCLRARPRTGPRIWGSNARSAATLPRVPAGSWTPHNEAGICVIAAVVGLPAARPMTRRRWRSPPQ